MKNEVVNSETIGNFYYNFQTHVHRYWVPIIVTTLLRISSHTKSNSFMKYNQFCSKRYLLFHTEIEMWIFINFFNLFTLMFAFFNPNDIHYFAVSILYLKNPQWKKWHVCFEYFQRSWEVFLYNGFVRNLIWSFNKWMHSNDYTKIVNALLKNNKLFLSELKRNPIEIFFSFNVNYTWHFSTIFLTFSEPHTVNLSGSLNDVILAKLRHWDTLR